MVHRNQPYVGVSGVVNPEQQRELVEVAQYELHATARRLALGVKATHKPQYEDVENKYGPLWYPVGNDIIKALDHRVQTYNIAQTYLEPEFIENDPDYPRAFMGKLNARMRDYLDAVQIDLLRFDTDPERYQHVFRAMAATGMQTIVQCHGYAMEEGPKSALDKLKRLVGEREIGFVLFDASHGRGQEMNPEALLPFIEAAYNDRDLAHKMTNFGVAGGLHAGNLEELLPKLLREFPELSWDAEGRLHDSIADGGDGSLNMDRTKQYLVRSAALLTEYV